MHGFSSTTNSPRKHIHNTQHTTHTNHKLNTTTKTKKHQPHVSCNDISQHETLQPGSPGLSIRFRDCKTRQALRAAASPGGQCEPVVTGPEKNRQNKFDTKCQALIPAPMVHIVHPSCSVSSKMSTWPRRSAVPVGANKPAVPPKSSPVVIRVVQPSG